MPPALATLEPPLLKYETTAGSDSNKRVEDDLVVSCASKLKVCCNTATGKKSGAAQNTFKISITCDLPAVINLWIGTGKVT